MITLPYTSRDYEVVFEGIKEIFKTLEPRADVEFDRANVETIISKIVSGCVDTLSYNQDANILEAFPSTARDSRAIFDLLSIVGYTPKTARCCHIYMTLWDPSFTGERTYAPYSYIVMDGKQFYNCDKFRVAAGITTPVDWYNGTLKAPDRRPQSEDIWNSENFVDNYYPNLSTNVIINRLYQLPEEHTMIDSETIRIFTEDGKKLTYVENPYMTNITKYSFSIVPSVNSKGYSFMFSVDVANGAAGSNFYYFYLVSDGGTTGLNIVPDFGGLSVNKEVPSFSYTYEFEPSKKPETAVEARENVVYEFGWRDTPKAIITKHDAERAILQQFTYIAAVDVRDGNDYSKCDPSLLDVHIYCKVNETYEMKMSQAVASGIANRLMTHISKFKVLPLNYVIHIDDVDIYENEDTACLYYWYPDITIYLKEQIEADEAAAILNSVHEALAERFKTYNMHFNEVPRVVDIIETVQNASETILYLDIDGINYLSAYKSTPAIKTDITCSFTEKVTANENPEDLVYKITLNTMDGIRFIKYHTVKIVTGNNEVIGYDNGDGTIMVQGYYLAGYGSINYETGELEFELSAPLADTEELFIYYMQETPTFCEYINTDAENGIKIALESLKAKNSISTYATY